MIYTTVEPGAPIRQGDIFTNVPRIDVDLENLSVLDGGVREAKWTEVARSDDPVCAVVALRPVTAITITQDCDAVRAPDITLCEINRFAVVEKRAAETSKPSKWETMITQHAKINQKWYYLPPDDVAGFTEKMAVDFRTTLRVSREQLENLRAFRKVCLNEHAVAHFRERIGEFFRRFPYNEWYPLNREEFEAYKKRIGGAGATAPQPYKGQE